jgi:hypothetical protein
MIAYVAIDQYQPLRGFTCERLMTYAMMRWFLDGSTALDSFEH